MIKAVGGRNRGKELKLRRKLKQVRREYKNEMGKAKLSELNKKRTAQ